MEFQSTERYYLDPELGAIVNMAIAMEKPLLLTGEAGTGKTQLAFEISRSLGMADRGAALQVHHQGRGGLLRPGHGAAPERRPLRHLGHGPGRQQLLRLRDLGAHRPRLPQRERGVLLLDEIDKTESDVQDNLLDVLEDCEFTIREVNQIVGAKQRPVIIITSNAKRELSDPFLRRCYCHHIAFPTPEQMREIVNLHFPDLDKGLLDSALGIFYELRGRGYEKPPATSELLNWLGALNHAGDAGPPERPLRRHAPQADGGHPLVPRRRQAGAGELTGTEEGGRPCSSTTSSSACGTMACRSR